MQIVSFLRTRAKSNKNILHACGGVYFGASICSSFHRFRRRIAVCIYIYISRVSFLATRKKKARRKREYVSTNDDSWIWSGEPGYTVRFSASTNRCYLTTTSSFFFRSFVNVTARIYAAPPITLILDRLYSEVRFNIGLHGSSCWLANMED